MNDQNWVECLIGTHGGNNEVRVANLERKILMLVEKKRRQVHRIRIAVAIAWAGLAGLIITGGTMEAIVGHSAITSAVAMTAQATLFIALILTVSWYVRSVSLRFDSVQQALAAIQDRLGQIQLESDGQRD